MGQRAQALADRFERANNELIATLDQCSDQQWRSSCKGEGWPVGVTAHHVAGGHQAISGYVQTLANGQQLPPMTPEMLDQLNAQHAQQFANCDRAETIDLLRRNGTAAASLVRGLSDEQLDRSAPFTMAGGASVSAQQLIENVLIGHVEGHSASIGSALGG